MTIIPTFTKTNLVFLLDEGKEENLWNAGNILFLALGVLFVVIMSCTFTLCTFLQIAIIHYFFLVHLKVRRNLIVVTMIKPFFTERERHCMLQSIPVLFFLFWTQEVIAQTTTGILQPWREGQETCKEIIPDLLNCWTNIFNCLPLDFLLCDKNKPSFF